LQDPNDGLWNVRSISRRGVHFDPSEQNGSGRNFDEPRFIENLGRITGFILADIAEFPQVEVFMVPVANVRRWYDRKILGQNANISRKKFHSILVCDIKN